MQRKGHGAVDQIRDRLRPAPGDLRQRMNGRLDSRGSLNDLRGYSFRNGRGLNRRHDWLILFRFLCMVRLGSISLGNSLGNKGRWDTLITIFIVLNTCSPECDPA